ncbi:MAG: glycoside hydrolase family 3 C-terminal domain-containing protein, partial [Candidatus Acidiferrales bacterium]
GTRAAGQAATTGASASVGSASHTAAAAATPGVSNPEVEKRVDAIVAKMTLEQKVAMVGGVNSFYVRGYPELGVPRVKMSDGPIGVRNYGPSTAYAAGIGLAASWDPKLAEEVGKEIGRDARARGVHYMLGPGVDIYRAPLNGRNFEYFGEDPFLGARIAVGYIEGMQGEGVSATIKHYMGNNSEFGRHITDSIIDERTMREIYLPIFEAAVKEAHVGAVMDSYNLVNGEHSTQNSYLNNEILKKEWGFPNVVMSDWSATDDGVAAANGGLDIEMPSGAFMTPKTLLDAVHDGKVSEATIDDKVRRLLRVEAEFGWLDRDQTEEAISRYNEEGRATALEGAREGLVLLKNEGGVLPLDKSRVKTVLVVGPNAFPAEPVGGGSAEVKPFNSVSALEGISNFVGKSGTVTYAEGVPTLAELARATKFTTDTAGTKPGIAAEHFSSEDLSGTAIASETAPYICYGQPDGWTPSHGGPPVETVPAGAKSSRWTGYYTPKSAGKFDIFVTSTGEDGGHHRLWVDGKVVFDDWTYAKELTGVATLDLDAKAHKVVLEQHGGSEWLGGRLRLGVVAHGSYVSNEAKHLAAKADAVVVAVGFGPQTESEGADRTWRLPPGQDELIEAMAAANKKTIVAITSGGSVDASEWVDRVPALVEQWYPGQEGGTALADVLFGASDPSGRLPITWERQWSDNPVHDNYYPADGTNKVIYKEGVFVGYRGYEHNGTKPLFPFGYGLSYTKFAYGKFAIRPVAFKMPAGSNPGPRYEISFDVTNTGHVAGADVAQVYIGEPGAKVARPPKELKGFSRVSLAPGETKHVRVVVDGRAFSYYDTDGKTWRADAGAFDVMVGRSSEEAELKGTITLTAKDADEATQKP